MNANQLISTTWQEYLEGKHEKAIKRLMQNRDGHVQRQLQKELDFLKSYTFPELKGVSQTQRYEYALAVTQSWLLKVSNFEMAYPLRGAVPLSVILGTEYYFDINIKKISKSIGQYDEIPPGAYGSTQLVMNYDDFWETWPEVVKLSELDWFSRAVFIRFIQYVQLNNSLVNTERVQLQADRRFNKACSRLSEAGFIAMDWNKETKLYALTVRQLKLTARKYGIELCSDYRNKAGLCAEIASKMNQEQVKETLANNNIPATHIHLQVNRIVDFKKFIWAEINRINLYTEWLVLKVSKRYSAQVNIPPHLPVGVLSLSPTFEPAIHTKGTVPFLWQHDTNPEVMNEDQKKFLGYLFDELKKSHYPDVEGNVGYLFTYAHSIIKQWNVKGYGYVYDALLNLADAYYDEEDFMSYCRDWSYDCLLAMKRYDEYLQLTTPEEVFPASNYYANDRCNILYMLGLSPSYKDVLTILRGGQSNRLTEYTLDNAKRMETILEEIFLDDEEKNGKWLERILANAYPSTYSRHSRPLFRFVPMETEAFLEFDFIDFLGPREPFSDIISGLLREAENRLRDQDSLPRIGEGWLGETSLYNAIKQAFPQTQVVHHGKTTWLGRQHLDIWLPHWRIAVEYHGEQHFQPVKFFGGQGGYEATVERDMRKAELCRQNNVMLIVATSNHTHDEIIRKIRLYRGI